MNIHTGTLRALGAAQDPVRAMVPAEYGVGAVLLADFNAGELSSGVTFERASTATYFDANGVMQTAAIDEPRFDHDPITDAYRGLMVEEARTNIIIHSEDFSSWLVGGTPVVTTNSAEAPDGNVTADTVEDDLASGFESVRLTPAVADDDAWWLGSIFIRKTTGGTAPRHGTNLSLAGGTTVNNFARLNTDSGDNISSSPGDSLVEDFDDYWRFLFWAQNNASGNTALNMGNFPAVRDTDAPPDQGSAVGEQVYWGAQAETSPFRTSSYIPTSGASATRSEDVVTFTIPSGISRVRYIFDDYSELELAVSPGPYQVETDPGVLDPGFIDRCRIRRIIGLP